MSRGDSVSRGEFHVEGGFRVEGGIPRRGGNSVSRGESHDKGGIPCRGGIVEDTQLYILLKKNLKSYFQKFFSGLADFCDLQSLAISGPSFLEN